MGIDSLTNGQLAALGISIGVIALVAFILWILEVIAGWKVFVKAGEPGWKSIIPIYSSYITYKIAWKPMMFWVTAVLGIAGNILSEQDGAMATIAGIIVLVAFVVNCIFSNKLAKSFGKGIGFTIGLIIFNPIFMLILGFGDARYEGPQN